MFGALLFGQKLVPAQVFGLALSFVGVLTIILHGEWARLLALDFSAGDLLVFAAMVCWAFYTLWLRGIPPEVDRIGLMAAQAGLGLLVLGPLCLIERGFGLAPNWSDGSLAALAYLGVFPSVFAYLLYNIGVAKVGAAKAGLFIHLIPVFGAVLAVAFLRESLHLYHAVGIAAILGGIACAVRPAKA